MPNKEAVKKMINGQEHGAINYSPITKTIICKKCGSEYNANFIKCPNCGYNRFMNALKVFLISLIVSFITFSSVYTVVGINKLRESVEQLSANINNSTYSDSTVEVYDISQASYYNDYLLKDNVDLSSLGNDYILYFHQDDCQYCMQANVYIDAYIGNKFNEKVPIYFVTPQSNNALFNSEIFGEYTTEDGTTMYGIDSTPTIVRMNKNKMVTKAIGSDEGFNLLDTVVKEIQGE